MPQTTFLTRVLKNARVDFTPTHRQPSPIRIATRRPSSTPSRSTSRGPRIGTSASASACTTVWVRRWPASRLPSRCLGSSNVPGRSSS